jgi:hypothetical protein
MSGGALDALLGVEKSSGLPLVKKGIGVYVKQKSDTRCVGLAGPALRADMA